MAVHWHAGQFLQLFHVHFFSHSCGLVSQSSLQKRSSLGGALVVGVGGALRHSEHSLHLFHVHFVVHSCGLQLQSLLQKRGSGDGAGDSSLDGSGATSASVGAFVGAVVGSDVSTGDIGGVGGGGTTDP